MRYPVKREFVFMMHKTGGNLYGKKSDFYKEWYRIQKDHQGTSGGEQSCGADR